MTPSTNSTGASVVRTMLAAVVLLGGAGVPMATLHAQQEPVIRPRTVAEDLQMFSQVLNQIRVNHPDSVDLHELFMAAIEGMILAVDPHSYVLPARRLSPDREKAARDGRLHPVPVTFTYIGDAPVVLNSGYAAAEGMDILPGDELTGIDGTAVSARSADELEIVLSGEAGSTVTLTFERQRLDGSLVTLVREVRRVKAGERSAVVASFALDDSTGYIRITHFLGDDVASDLREAMVTLEKSGMQRLILDLRQNGGGDPEAAARIAGEFLPRGAVVYRSVGRRADVERTVEVERSFLRPGGRTYPLVLLVDHGTASAAELLAGALQDHDRALIVGRPTFGKALLMRGFPLSDGSVIMLVVGHLQTPCGRVVQRAYRGVTPREYYRMSRGERETAGLPSCTTMGGRTVYGGDGIRPDVILPTSRPEPAWAARLFEDDLPLRWVGAFLDAGAALPELDELALDPRLPPGTVDDFRAFAVQQGAELPDGSAADQRIEALLLRSVVIARWGAAGYYRIAAILDPAVAAAAAEFPEAVNLPVKR